MNRLKNFLFNNTTVRQTVAKNTFWLFFGHAATRFFKFFLVVAAARVLGASLYGSFSFALSFAATAFMFSNLGTAGVMIREYSKNQWDKKSLIANSLYLKIILTSLSLLAGILLIPTITDEAAKGIILYLLLLVTLRNFRSFLLSIKRAKERMEIESLIMVTDSVITTGVGLLVLVFAPSLVNFALAYLSGMCVSLIILVSVSIKDLLAFRLKPDAAIIKKILMIAWPFAFASTITVIMHNTDSLMLGWLKNPEMVGYYAAGLKIIQLTFLIPALFTSALFPVFSRFYDNREKLALLTKKSASFLSMLAFPIMAGGIMTGESVIRFIFGKEYLPGVLPFQILLLLVPLMFLIILWHTVLFSMNLQVKNMQYTAVAAGLNLILNFVFISYLDVAGAALATLLSQLIHFILIHHLAKKSLNAKLLSFAAIKPYLAAALAMTLFLAIPIIAAAPIYVTVPGGALVYALVLLALKAPIVEEMAELLQMRKKPPLPLNGN